LSGGNFGDNAVGYLIDVLHKMSKLKTLKLNNNRIRDEGAAKLAKALKNTKLEELYIWLNDFRQTGFEDLMTAWGDREGLHLWYGE
jgi:Ran GTPase-activating protein (RanGAP) involved in mRNA processing and transport